MRPPRQGLGRASPAAAEPFLLAGLGYREGHTMNLLSILLAQNDNAGGVLGGLLGMCCNCVILLGIVVAFVGMWKVFEKAGQPGWAGIIPIYNAYILTTEIARKEILWFVLLLVPCVNIVAAVIICIEVAKNFGKDPAFGIGLALLSPIFFPILGFSDAKFQPKAPSPPPAI
jgi:Family of unknown function (DUF5684)